MTLSSHLEIASSAEDLLADYDGTCARTDPGFPFGAPCVQDSDCGVQSGSCGPVAGVFNDSSGNVDDFFNCGP